MEGWVVMLYRGNYIGSGEGEQQCTVRFQIEMRFGSMNRNESCCIFLRCSLFLFEVQVFKKVNNLGLQKAAFSQHLSLVAAYTSYRRVL